MAKTTKQAFGRIREAAENNTTRYKKDFSVEMTTLFARYTPVETGRATGNWVLNPNRPSLRPLKIYDRSNTASTVRDNAERSARRIKKDDDIYISNAVQGEDDNGNFNGQGYILKLEDGASRQSPAGMFLINIAKSKAVSRMVKRRMFR